MINHKSKSIYAVELKNDKFVVVLLENKKRVETNFTYDTQSQAVEQAASLAHKYNKNFCLPSLF